MPFLEPGLGRGSTPTAGGCMLPFPEASELPGEGVATKPQFCPRLLYPALAESRDLPPASWRWAWQPSLSGVMSSGASSEPLDTPPAPRETQTALLAPRPQVPGLGRRQVTGRRGGERQAARGRGPGKCTPQPISGLPSRWIQLQAPDHGTLQAPSYSSQSSIHWRRHTSSAGHRFRSAAAGLLPRGPTRVGFPRALSGWARAGWGFWWHCGEC